MRLLRPARLPRLPRYAMSSFRAKPAGMNTNSTEINNEIVNEIISPDPLAKVQAQAPLDTTPAQGGILPAPTAPAPAPALPAEPATAPPADPVRDQSKTANPKSKMATPLLFAP